MKLKVVLSAAAAICLGVSAAIAAGEPQVVRQEEMKKVGGAMGAIGYALSCPASSLAFVALWYTLGMVLTASIGAWLGPRVFRW